MQRWRTLESRAAAPARVFLFALIVRVAFAWAVPTPPLSGDAVDYDRLARSIVSGQGYVAPDGLPTSDRPPLYSYFLATAYSLHDNGPALARGLQAVVDALTCVMVYVLARRHFGVPAARVAAVLAVGSLSLIFATRHLLAETFAAFFMVAAVLALDVGLTLWQGRVFVLAGICVGLSTLNKATTLVLPPLLMLPIWLAAGKKWSPTIRAGVLLLAGFIGVLLPWAIRNYQVHGELVPVATQVGYVAYSSYVPPEGKIFGVYTDDETSIRAKALPEVERSRVFLDATLRHVREHPEELPRLQLLKFLYFISPFDWELLGGNGVFNFTYSLTVPFALYGLWLARAQGWPPVLLAIPPAFLLLLSFALYGSPRLRVPAEPLMMVFAGAGVVDAWQRTEAHRPAREVIAACLVVAAFMAYLFSAEVKAFSAQILRSLGAW